MNAKITPIKAGGTLVGVGASSPECSAPPGRRVAQRLRVWEIASTFHCSVLGTCLPLSELHDIARRARYGLPPRASAYEVHSYFVKSLTTCNGLSKLVDKALEKRHENATRVIRRAKNEQELEVRWKETLEAGNVAGAYWAVMSHPLSTEALQWRLFGDVHMLSHLLGASRRSDLCRLHKLEVLCAELESELAFVKHQHRAILKQKHKLADDLTEKSRAVERLDQRLALAQGRISALRTQGGVAELETRVHHLESALDASRNRAVTAETRLAETRARLAESREASNLACDQVRQLVEENAALEAELRENVESSLEWRRASGTTGDQERRLDGRCILYVGGRSNLVPYYRALVERCGAQFLHHDGGIEESLDTLTRGLVSVDAVVCPIDCVSHAACLKVKRACKRLSKQFIVLRSSGLSSFARVIRSVV